MKKVIQLIRRHIKPLTGLMVLPVAWAVLHFLRREILRKRIWLICEKRNEARDNGYHFYKYLKAHHPEINSYYVITKDAADLHKVQKLGNVIYADSFKHALYYLAAVRSISSQAYGAFPFGFNQKELKIAGVFCNPIQKVVHLRHGIQKDELAHSAFDYDKCNIDFIASAARREYEFIRKEYGYPSKAIGLVGFCRFDNLHRQVNAKDKIILIMPTWRMWLRRERSGVPLTAQEIENFKNSDFFLQYSKLMTSPELIKYMGENGFKLVFYIHYQLQDYSELFNELSNEIVIIADRYHYDVQALLMESKVLVSDYSSVQFDFAYMGKPILYYQFDKARFEKNHYAKGYFSYERDGFGPCCYHAEDVISVLQELMSTECKQPEMYQNRATEFFGIRDDKNCERTFEAINNL